MALSTEYTDPSILAFLRAAGYADSAAAADVGRRRGDIENALGLSLDDLDARGQEAREGIAGDQESRGVLASGQTLTRQGRQEAAQGRQVGALSQQAASQIGTLSSGLTQQIAQNQQRAHEMGLTQGQKAELTSGQAAIDAKYADPYGSDEDY